MTRRNWFASLLVPFLRSFKREKSFIEVINDGINPDWDGTIGRKVGETIYWHGQLPYVFLNLTTPLPWETLDGGTKIQEAFIYVEQPRICSKLIGFNG